MYFALIYLFIFGLDILLIHKFQALGLMPMDYLVAGVGVFCSLLFMKQYKSFRMLKREETVFKIFILYVLIVALFRFGTPIMSLIYASLKLKVLYDSAIEYILTGYSILLCIIIPVVMDMKAKLPRWLFFSTFSAIFASLQLHLFFNHSLSILIWRYSGIFDLFMLFGWLMIIHTLMHAEDDARSSVDAIPTFH